MKFFHAKTGLAFCCSYLGLYLLSGIYAVFVLRFSRPMPEFNPPSIAALPWSLPLISFWHSVGILNVYDRLAGSPVLYAALMWSTLLPGALLNAVILYIFVRFLDGLKAK